MLASIRNLFIFSLLNRGEKMKKLIILLCLLIVTALLIAKMAPDTFRNERGPNENAGIRFDLDATTYGNQNDTTMTIPGVGVYIRLDVYAINVHNLDTYEFEVLFNPNQLDYITATATNPITYEQNILTTNGGTALGWMIDTSTPGVLSIAYTLAGTDTLEAPEGEGLIADIVFQVLSTIGDSLSFGDVYFYDSFGVMDIITDKGIAIIYESGNVDGTVTDSNTGEPIEGAIVSIGDFSDTTGTYGTYLLEYIPIGIYDITCTAEGYSDTADVVEVLEGQTVTVDFILEPIIPYGSLNGTVTDANTNEPIEGALITATSQGRVEYTDSTNPDGYYVIDSMFISEVVGNYTVTCDAGYSYILGEVTEVEIIVDSTTTIDFTLNSTVTVDIPNGGEEWTVGETHQILWTAEDYLVINSDSVFYSIDDGANWIFIASHTGNLQVCEWSIPNTPSTECLVKVIVYDGGANSATDISDAVFTINADITLPTVEVIEPNGGEDWVTYEWHPVTWIANDNIGVIGDSVYYSIDDGANWTLIASHTGNPQNFSWHIPNTPSEECLIKVKVFDASNNFAEDISDGTFIITYIEPPPLFYAVVIKQATYNDPDWQAVADALLARYGGQLFIWESSLNEVQDDVALYHPSHIGFICEMSTASPSFIQNYIWPFTRTLDTDVYCDAVWGIVTGYNAQDALNLVSGPTGFEVKTCIGGTTSCNVNYYTQGISTSEATYNRYYVKYPDALEVVEFNDGPTDRTEWLVTMVNEGVNIFDYDPVDIFVTSGHGNHNQWQLHYPTSGQEGFFRSSNGQAYGDPYSGPDINIDSDNPKIYFGLGNCNIGQILGGGSMAPCWIHTGGAYQYTGYVIPEGGSSCQHGGTKAYFYKAARNNTWAESYFLSNIALKFDMLNSTPGASPPDLNGSALYGDPGMDIKMSNEDVFMEPLFTNELTINEGTERDTITYRITMNREGNPGFTSKWGERHPAIILPFKAEDIQIVYTDAIAVVVEDNFALMYIWYQGQPSLAEGTTREVIFACNHSGVDIEEQIVPEITKARLYQNYPNPFNPTTTISFSVAQTLSFVSLDIYNVKGQKVISLANNEFDRGNHSIIWDGYNDSGNLVGSGVYFYKFELNGKTIGIKKMLLLK